MRRFADLYNTDSGQPVGDWGNLGQIPPTPTTLEHGTMVPQQPQQNQLDPATAEALGYWKCPGKLSNPTRPCDFWLSPVQKYQIEHSSGYFTCPRCRHNFDLMDELPSHGLMPPEGAQGKLFTAGGKTRIGLPLGDQGQIGENIVANMGEIPGYGPITWWHPGGAQSNSPLDGSTTEWGIEVKTLNYDNMHHRFNPGGDSKENGDFQGGTRRVIEDKNNMAREMGLKGVLGILVLLDYRRDVADIYLKEMPLTPWADASGRTRQGVAQFRKNTAIHLVKEVAFASPYKDPNNPSPMAYQADAYYEKPEVAMPQQLQQDNEPAPF